MLRCSYRSSLTLPVLLFAASACGDDPDDLGPTDAGGGGNPDATMFERDMGAPDAGTDTGEDGGVAVMDAGPPDLGEPDLGQTDMGPPDAGAFGCAFPEPVTGVLDQTAEVMLDTSATELRPRDLGLLCGNTDPATRWAPQQIIAYEVPGSGPVAVRFSARSQGTSTLFDTVIQVRRGACASPPSFQNGRFPSPTCFEDSTGNVQQPDFRSEGAVQVTGGETIYFVVTGFSGGQVPQLEDEGPVTLSITPSVNEPPTLTTAEFLVFASDVFIPLTGSDPENNVRGAIINFRVGGQIADIYGIGSSDGDVSIIVFDELPGEVRNHIARPQLPVMVNGTPPPGVEGFLELRADTVGLNPALGTFVRNARVDQVGLRLYDDAYALSNELVVDVDLNAQVPTFGDACTVLCEEPYECNAGTCGPNPVAQAACDPMNTVDGGLSATSTASLVAVTIPAGSGGFGAPSCVPRSGTVSGEGVIDITIPSTGRFDLLATTETPITGNLDTFMYLRSDCVDPGSELACNNNIASANRASAISVQDIAPGQYALVVELLIPNPLTIPDEVGVDLRLRAIVGEGDACDPSGVVTRCEVGTCQGTAGAETCEL